MPALSISLLGPPVVTVEGLPANFDTRRAIALLAYLAVTRQPYTRDALAALLWPDFDQTHARATLRRTLSTLNKVVAPAVTLTGDWLRTGRDTIQVHASPDVYLDVEHFGALLGVCRTHGHGASEVCDGCLPALAEAVSLYRGDFMSGFGLKDSWDFDEWQHLQAESLRRDLASALERLSYAHAALQQFEQAISYARRWLALDRLHEAAHRRLMQLYAWAGQRSAALQQYRDCVHILEQELGVAPLDATTQLYEAVKEHRLPPLPTLSHTGSQPTGRTPTPQAVTTSGGAPPPEEPAATAAARAPAPRKSLPLVGRSAEWQRLLDAYAEVGPNGHVIVVQGEAGIGKTRLAEEFLEHASAAGSLVVAARCYEGEADLAYGPVVSLLRGALDQPLAAGWQAKVPAMWLAEAARLLPEIAPARAELPATPPLDSPVAQSRFFEGIRQVLLALADPADGAGGVVLLVDDLHCADHSSLDMLTYLLRRLKDWPVCLFLTWRTDHQPGDGRILHLLHDAHRSRQATVLSLRRLKETDVQELVNSLDQGDYTAQPALAARLYQETEGLPFFLAEYLNILERGNQPASATEWAVPLSVRDLLRSRLTAVSDTGWQLLHAAAVIGRSFDFDTLHQASGRSEEEAVTALEELISLGLVTELGANEGSKAATLTYDFSHEKLRALVYDETSLARRRLLHRRVAEALAAGGRAHSEAGPLASQIAHHYRLAGNERAAAEYFRLAGEHARQLYANAEALAHLQTALALGHPDISALHEAIGDIQTLLGEYSAALASYERAASLVAQDDAGRRTLSRLEHRLSSVYIRRGEWDLAESHLEAALHGCSEAEEANHCAIIYADRSLAAYSQGHSDRARELARRALELAEAGRDARALAQAHNILGIVAGRTGDQVAAREHLEQSLALTEKLDEPSIRAAALNNLALIYGAAGRVEDALGLGEQALALVVSQGDRHREAALHNNLADLLHAAGRTGEAMAHLKRSVAIYAEIGVEKGAYQPAIWRLVEW